MAGTATLRNNYRQIYCAGEDAFSLNYLDFNLSDAAPRGGETIHFVITNFLPFVTNTNDNSNIIITPLKHIKSTSLAQDTDWYAPNKNTSTEDLMNTAVHFIGYIIHPTWGNYNFDFYLDYYAAIWPPIIDVPRLRGSLYSSGNDYNTIFTNAQINALSKHVPNKITPHSVDECLGYSPTYYPMGITKLPEGPITIPWYNSSTVHTFKLNYRVIAGEVSQINVPNNSITNPNTNGDISAFYNLGTNVYNITAVVNGNTRIIDTKTVVVSKEASKVAISGLTVNTGTSKATFNYTNSSGITAFRVDVTAISTHPDRGTESNNTTYENVSFGTSGSLSLTYYLRPPVDGKQVLKIIAVTVFYGTYNIASANWYAGASSNLAVSPTSLSFGSGVGTQSINVTSNYPEQWTASANQTWVTLTKVTGGYTVATTANSGTERTATITVTDSVNGETKTVSVTQASGVVAEYVNANPDMLDFMWNDGFQQVVKIFSSGPWIITIPSAHISWIFVDSISGNNGDTIGVSVVENSKYTPRVGTFTINCGTASLTVTVNQDGQNT